MDEIKQPEQNEHSFIREKIIGKRKSKLKRIVLLACGAVALAVLFGVVSRICFIASEPFVNKLLGISPTPVPTQPVRNQVTLPSSQGEPTPAQRPTENLPPAAPEHVDIAEGEQSENTEPAEPTATPEPEQGQLTGIGEYIAIHQEIRRVATNAASAMANITVTTERTDWFEQTYEESTNISGVIVGDNGVELLILTEANPLVNADSVKVTVGGYTTDETVLFMVDSHYNMAIIAIDYASIPSENLENINYGVFGESHSLFVGTPVIAIGNPNGYIGSFEMGTVTARSSFAYIADNRLDLFNTNIPDYENGTGVIISTSGEIIGLITHSFKDGINANLNTAIGISRVKPIIEKLVNGKKLNYFGVVAEEMTDEQRETINTKIGIHVTEVIPGSPAEQAGIRKGDVILIVERTPMNSVTALNVLLEEYTEGDEMRVTMLRKGPRAYSEVETTVTVGEKSMPTSGWN